MNTLNKMRTPILADYSNIYGFEYVYTIKDDVESGFFFDHLNSYLLQDRESFLAYRGYFINGEYLNNTYSNYQPPDEVDEELELCRV